MSVPTERFPGAHDGWARFDGPAGTLMVDSAIEAMHGYASSATWANSGGAFEASRDTDQLVGGARAAVAALLGASADGIVFGANMTTLTFAFSRAVARTLSPGDEVICTELDHDANVTPWVVAAEERGATVVVAELDPASGTLPTAAVLDRISERTRWVAVTGASNLLGSIPDIAPIVAGAHDAGARVYVDAVHLVPHRRVDVGALGCDALVTSAYKWYGPHAGVLALSPELLAEIEPYRVRPAPDRGPDRFETGTKAFEAITAVAAAAAFLADQHRSGLVDDEQAVFAPLLEGLLGMPHVRVIGPTGMADRTPTLLFSVEGESPDAVAAALARERIAAWSGDNYAFEAARALGIAAAGSGVRLGVVRYTSPDDVDRALRAIDALR
jgi:cysteine desulfurase family protein (TIGR01976 family)